MSRRDKNSHFQDGDPRSFLPNQCAEKVRRGWNWIVAALISAVVALLGAGFGWPAIEVLGIVMTIFGVFWGRHLIDTGNKSVEDFSLPPKAEPEPKA